MDSDYVRAQQRAKNWHDMPNHEQFVQSSLLERDDETHFRLRVIVLRALSRRFVEQQRSMIESYVDLLLDKLLQRREFDFVEDLASHVPGHIIGHLLGVPIEDCPQLRVWSENIVQFFDVDRTKKHKLLAEKATTEFYLYLSDLIKARRKRPQEDLISSLVAAQEWQPYWCAQRGFDLAVACLCRVCSHPGISSSASLGTQKKKISHLCRWPAAPRRIDCLCSH